MGISDEKLRHKNGYKNKDSVMTIKKKLRETFSVFGQKNGLISSN